MKEDLNFSQLGTAQPQLVSGFFSKIVPAFINVAEAKVSQALPANYAVSLTMVKLERYFVTHPHHHITTVLADFST